MCSILNKIIYLFNLCILCRYLIFILFIITCTSQRIISHSLNHRIQHKLPELLPLPMRFFKNLIITKFFILRFIFVSPHCHSMPIILRLKNKSLKKNALNKFSCNCFPARLRYKYQMHCDHRRITLLYVRTHARPARALTHTKTQ